MGITLWVVALSAPLAKADPYTPPSIGSTDPELPALSVCPEAPAASESEDAVVVELREGRREAAQVCRVVDEMLRELARRQWWTVAEVNRLHDGVATEGTLVGVGEDLAAVRAAVTQAGGLQVFLKGQEGPVTVSVPEALEVSNPPNVAAVESAVVQGTETSNQNLWGLAGLLTGSMLLMVFWKLVRP